jgi:nucleoside-diphosphate-sugar epimerase
MARALIVGCGCRGRELGGRLLEAGWAVRGTSRSEQGLAAIEAAGIEPALADPERPGTVLDLVGDVAVLHWLLGSAGGDPEAVAAVHGERLERILERLVETPVRAFVYEAAGSVDAVVRERGEAAVRAAAERWRIPVAVLEADPGDSSAWVEAALSASLELASPAGGSI